MNEQLKNQKEEKNIKLIKKTHCWNCKKDINSQQWDICEICRGISCSCGACFCGWEEWY